MSQRKRKPGRGAGIASGPVTATRTRPIAPPSLDTPTVLEIPPAAAQPSPEPASRPVAMRPPVPEAEQHWVERYAARAELKNAEARAKIVPLAEGEHPWALRIAIGLAFVFSLGTLVLMVARVKVDGRPPSNSWIAYVAVMFACAVGMWRHWYQAVLAFMCLLAIALVILCALVVRFSNLLGLIIPLVLIFAGGALFWKLVGVLGRMQAPQRPVRSAAKP